MKDILSFDEVVINFNLSGNDDMNLKSKILKYLKNYFFAFFQCPTSKVIFIYPNRDSVARAIGEYFKFKMVLDCSLSINKFN